jgi:chorismate lyase/3-hydroxybenzoate synthase
VTRVPAPRAAQAPRPLRLHLCAPEHARQLAQDRRLAARVVAGRDEGVLVRDGVLEVRVATPPLLGEPLVEAWSVQEAPCLLTHEGGVALVRTGTAVIATGAAPAAGAALEPAAQALYGRLLGAIDDAGCPHLVRAWNYVPEINAVEDGLERYRRFNRARARAFDEARGTDHPEVYSASSAVGSAGERLLVILVAEQRPGVHRENPRQVSAYRYPPLYGPRSPSFARATLAPGPGTELFISGTASIRGHRTHHPGHLDRQVDETLANIRELVESTAADRGLPLSYPRSLEALKVYVRRAGDAGRVAERLERTIGPGTPRLFVQADICRADLLVEIEGVARSRPPGSP